jgi:Ca2+-binding EF-hand superfamily protein
MSQLSDNEIDYPEKFDIDKGILEYFVNTIKLGRDCEVLKQIINQKADFEPYYVFTRIDRLDKGYIDTEDLINFLKDNEFFIPAKDKKGVDLLIEYYDRDFDGKLNFEEFLMLILNKTNSTLRAVSTQRKTLKTPHYDYLSDELENLASKLIIKELNLFQWADKKKVELHMNKFDLLDVFVMIDCDKDGFINLEDMEKFLRGKDVILYKEEINSIISLFDEDLDHKLNWNEFLFMILPSKLSYDYDYVWLREMENEHMNLYYESLRRERLKKDLMHEEMQIGNKSVSVENYSRQRDEKTLSKNSYPVSLNNSFQNSKPVELLYNKFYNTDFAFEYFISEIFNLLIIDKEIEQLRISLAQNENFNFITIFKFFDKNKEDYVSFSNFVSELEYFDICFYPDYMRDAELLFKKFDKYGNNKIK